MAEKLAIAIPTYARVSALAANLPILLKEAEQLGVPVYLSDDSLDDETEKLITSLLRSFALLRYRRNKPALGHDYNIISSLTWPEADYVWILGDTWRPKEGELAAVLGFLCDQDFLFLNRSSDDGEMVFHVEGEAARDLILSKLWHQTLTAATIYRRSVITWVERSLAKVHSNFPQIDIILGYSERNRVAIGWFGRKILHCEPKLTSYWRANALDVFVDDWVAVVKAYPRAVPSERIVYVLKSHSASTKLFSHGYLRELAESGQFGMTAFRRPHFWDVMHESRVRILAALLPSFLYRPLLAIKHRTRRKWT